MQFLRQRCLSYLEAKQNHEGFWILWVTSMYERQVLAKNRPSLIGFYWVRYLYTRVHVFVKFDKYYKAFHLSYCTRVWVKNDSFIKEDWPLEAVKFQRPMSVINYFTKFHKHTHTHNP